MPSSMIHLLTAYKFNPKSSVAFYIGNIAPDSVSDWKEKDKIHFRDRNDRLNDLLELTLSMNLKDDLNKGILLHIFLDYKWDASPLKSFINNYNDDNWFQAYRDEIALAGAWLYHHTQWSNTVWDDMKLCSTSTYENTNGFIKEDISDFIVRNHKWYNENNIGPSSVFTPDFIEEFTDNVVNEFVLWLVNMNAK